MDLNTLESIQENPSTKNRITKWSKEQDIENKIKIIESRLRDKLRVQYQFVDDNLQASKFCKFLIEYIKIDVNKMNMTFNEFFNAMTFLNFVGIQTEIEDVFNKYDETAQGFINIENFSNKLFGLHLKNTNNLENKNDGNLIELFKSKIMAKGVGGIHAARKALARFDADGSGTLDIDEVKQGLNSMGVIDFSDTDLIKLFKYFDKGDDLRINPEELLKGFTTGMSYTRKRVVREAFDTLDSAISPGGEGSGEISLNHILDNFNVYGHPDVINNTISANEAFSELQTHFHKTANTQGVVEWDSFLEYYRGLSISIVEDDIFETMVRSSWSLNEKSQEDIDIAGSFGGVRRILCKMEDNTEEVFEIPDSSTLKLDARSLQQVLENQMGISGIKYVCV